MHSLLAVSVQVAHPVEHCMQILLAVRKYLTAGQSMQKCIRKIKQINQNNNNYFGRISFLHAEACQAGRLNGIPCHKDNIHLRISSKIFDSH